MNRVVNRAILVGIVVGTVNWAAPAVVDLGESVVVAAGYEQSIADTPYAVQEIDADEMHLRLQAPTLAESLKAVPGVLLQKTGHGMTSPYLRGFTSQRTVLMADGVRVNNSFLREGPNQYWNQLDSFFYDDLEVMQGPGSVQYGSDAIGGVVYARSKALARGDGNGFQWHGGQVIGRWSSAERSFSEHVDGEAALGGRMTLRLGVTRQDFGDLESGDSIRNPQTDFDQWGLNGRLAYWIDDDQSLVLGYDHFDQNDVNRVHRTIFHQDFKGTSSKGSTGDLARLYDHDRRTAFARYEKLNGDGWLEELRLQVSYTYFEEDYHRQRTAVRYEDRQATFDTLGVLLQAKSPSPWGSWNYGIDFYHDWVDTAGQNVNNGIRTNLVQGVVADDATYSLFGAYLQHETVVNDRLTVTAGARYTHAEMDAGKVQFTNPSSVGSVSGSWDAVTGSLRAMLHVNDQLSGYAGVSQGFRAPNLSDATRDDEFGGGSESPNANLDPEYFTTLEIGVRKHSGRSRLKVAGYYTFIQDRIARLTNGGIETKRNLDSGYVQGIDALGELDLTDRLTLLGRISWQEGNEDGYVNREITNPEAERPLSRMLPLSGQVGLRWQAPEKRWWSECVLEVAERQDRLADTEVGDNRFPPAGTPGYGVVHLRSGIKLNDATDLSVALENVGDKEYRIHGSGVNEPGRNLVVTLRYRF